MLKCLHQEMQQYARRLVPRMLSQACRDPGSQCYGCYDRDWWHYKIRDFPSVILQQGAYATWLAADAGLAPAEARNISSAACLFWNQRAVRLGAFEEYYPWEQGYPPLAFSSLAIAKLVAAGAVEARAVESGMRIAARQLGKRFESQAANQQVAGLAALAWIRKLYPSLVTAERVADVKARTLALQTGQGWFPEYGGPDLGYLSVAMDCLWDAFDATGDDAYVAAAERALTYLLPFVALPSRGVGMHNARNTDYILPYGIARFLVRGGEAASTAAYVLERTWGHIGQQDHFAHAIDDRYWCHYSGHSLLRAVAILSTTPLVEPSQVTPQSRPAGDDGQFIAVSQDRSPSLLISLRKGGVLHAWCEDAELADYGWVISAGRQRWVTNAWDGSKGRQEDPQHIVIDGFAVPHREQLPSPYTHVALRAISGTLGRRVIQSLKRRLIFHDVTSAISFTREIRWEAAEVTVLDRFSGLPSAYSITRAPRANLRHVASADSFHREDAALLRGWLRQETIQRRPGACSIQTTYQRESKEGS